MIACRPCVNGILAAVLSASFAPVPAAFAKDANSPTAQAKAKTAAKKPGKTQAGSKDDAAKSDSTTNPSAGDAEPNEK
jgi:hypothetical protein